MHHQKSLAAVRGSFSVVVQRVAKAFEPQASFVSPRMSRDTAGVTTNAGPIRPEACRTGGSHPWSVALGARNTLPVAQCSSSRVTAATASVARRCAAAQMLGHSDAAGHRGRWMGSLRLIRDQSAWLRPCSYTHESEIRRQ